MDRPYKPIRHEHYLTRIKRSSAPQLFVALDIHADVKQTQGKPDTETHRFSCGHAVAYSVRGGQSTLLREISFRQRTEFWSWLNSLARSSKTIHVVGHRIGNDMSMLGLWDMMDRREVSLSAENARHGPSTIDAGQPDSTWRGTLILEDPPTYICCMHLGRKLKILDIRNYLPVPVYDIASLVGTTIGPERTEDQGHDYSAWRTSTVSHAIGAAFAALIELWNLIDGGEWRPTITGLAWQQYRKHFLPSVTVLVHGHNVALEMERQCYYGGGIHVFGRVDVLRHDQCDWLTGVYWSPDRPAVRGPVYHVDCNSLYPYVMENLHVPVKLDRIELEPMVSDLEKITDQYQCLGRVQIVEPCGRYPMRTTDRTIYPNSTIWTVLAGPELIEAHKRGQIERVGCLVWYHCQPIFSGLIYWFRHLKNSLQSQGNLLELKFLKLLVNSLCGKFGQRRIRWEDDDDATCFQPWGSWVELSGSDTPYQVRRAIGSSVQTKEKVGESADSCPAIAAWITSAARVYMQLMLDVAGRDDVLYMATDSLHCLKPAYQALGEFGALHPTELGKFKLVGEHDTASYIGPNHYRLDGEMTSSMVSLDSECEADGRYRMLRYPSMKDLTTGKPSKDLRVRVMRKTLELSCEPYRYSTNGQRLPLTEWTSD